MGGDGRDPALDRLLDQVARACGFRGDVYKQGCITRRIAVRMRARGSASYDAYAELLRGDPAEYEHLLDALTINLSRFYRNPETWDALDRTVLPALAALVSTIWGARRIGAAVTLISSLGVFALSSLVTAQAVRHGTVEAPGGWLTCDPLGALILLLVAFVGLTAALFSAGYIGARSGHATGPNQRQYYVLYNLFVLSMLAVPVIAHVAVLWIAVALTTLLSAFLVGFEDTPEALEAAWKYVLIASVGLGIGLLAVILLYAAGTGPLLGGGAGGLGFSVAGVPPEIMGIGPKEAIPRALRQTGLKLDDMGWIELNEAFAAQSLAVIQDVGLDPARVNPLGGAIALGHPLGATGAIRTATLLHGLRRTKQKYGMVTMCIGTGMGAAGIFEAL